MKTYNRNKTWVKAGKNWVDAEYVEFLDIKIDNMGRDVMSFIYNDHEYQSLILVSSLRPI